jgi:hypothetical protein
MSKGTIREHLADFHKQSGHFTPTNRQVREGEWVRGEARSCPSEEQFRSVWSDIVNRRSSAAGIARKHKLPYGPRASHVPRPLAGRAILAELAHAAGKLSSIASTTVDETQPKEMSPESVGGLLCDREPGHNQMVQWRVSEGSERPCLRQNANARVRARRIERPTATNTRFLCRCLDPGRVHYACGRELQLEKLTELRGRICSTATKRSAKNSAESSGERPARITRERPEERKKCG